MVFGLCCSSIIMKFFILVNFFNFLFAVLFQVLNFFKIIFTTCFSFVQKTFLPNLTTNISEPEIVNPNNIDPDILMRMVSEIKALSIIVKNIVTFNWDMSVIKEEIGELTKKIANISLYLFQIVKVLAFWFMIYKVYSTFQFLLFAVFKSTINLVNGFFKFI